MQHREGSLLKRLEEFSLKNRELLAEGKDLLESLSKDHAQKYVDNPLLLSLVLGKYCDLIEERLLPSLPATRESAQDGEGKACVESGTGKLNKAHSRDDFRNTDPTVPAIRAVPRPEPVHKAATGATANKAQSNNRVDDFRGNTQPPRPQAAGQSQSSPAQPKPTVSAAPKMPEPVEVPKATSASPRKPIVQTCAHTHSTTECGKQRRQTERYQCRMPIHYHVMGRDRREVKAYSKDAGAMGLFIMANRPEKAGEQIALKVELPDHKTAVLQAVVTWTKWVAPNLRSVDMPGFGVKVISASENWYTYFFQAEDGRMAHA